MADGLELRRELVNGIECAREQRQRSDNEVRNGGRMIELLRPN